MKEDLPTTGINVASDRRAGRRYADLIVDGHKTLESRNSDTLHPYVGKRVAIVRTGEGKAKAIGEATIGEPMVVNKKQFRSLEDHHLVPSGSAFDISTPTKHLYPIHNPVRYPEERDVGHGIIARKLKLAEGGNVQGSIAPTMKTTQQMRDELMLKAPVSPHGFYSPVEQAALNIKRKAGNLQAFMNDMRAVPKDQLEHTKLQALFKAKPTATREEVQAHISKNKPEVKEVTLRPADDIERAVYKVLPVGYHPVFDENTEELRIADRRYPGDHSLLTLDQLPDDVKDLVRSEGAGVSQYHDRPELQLPGGNKNYREVLLKLPDAGEARFRELEEKISSRRVTPAERNEYNNWHGAKREGVYRSNHWDQPNVLAHIRMNDRTDADGNRVLFVEELQSDWGQAAKKSGFNDGPAEAPLVQAGERESLISLMQKRAQDRMIEVGIEAKQARDVANGLGHNTLAAAAGMKEQYDDLIRREMADRDRQLQRDRAVPRAPFITKTNDWVNLALKHVLKKAAKEGYDKVAFINGEQSADRYSLDKYLSSIHAKPVHGGNFELHVTDEDGKRTTNVAVPRDKLHEHVGKEFADKIINQNGGYFEGEGLKVPHKGMRNFYDKIVPDQVQAMIGKFGGKPERVHIETSGKPSWSNEPKQYSPQLGFDITPEMRQNILKPMSYRRGGKVSMDEMRLKVWDRKGR